MVVRFEPGISMPKHKGSQSRTKKANDLEFLRVGGCWVEGDGNCPLSSAVYKCTMFHRIGKNESYLSAQVVFNSLSYGPRYNCFQIN